MVTGLLPMREGTNSRLYVRGLSLSSVLLVEYFRQPVMYRHIGDTNDLADLTVSHALDTSGKDILVRLVQPLTNCWSVARKIALFSKF